MLRFLVSIFCLVTLVAGCSEQQIEVQTVPVEQSKYGFFREPGAGGQSAFQPPAATAENVPQRMIVAMFDQPTVTWFLKAQGNEEAVDEHEEQILKFFRDVTFEQNKPQWELPEGWTDGPQSTSTFGPLATLIIDADSQTKLSISKLSANQDLLANANRWRRQLNLAPLTEDQIETEFAKTEGDDFYLFDAVGTGTGQMSSGGRRAPFANMPFAGPGAMQGKGNSGPLRNPAPRPSAGSSLKYDSPAGWAKSESSGMISSTRFTKPSDDDPEKTSLITLTRMSASANNWPANAKRWADQASQSFTDEELTAATEELTIDGQPSQLIELLDGDPENAIVAVMTVAGKDAWFFKLKGDKKSVAKEQPAFRKLLDSIKFN